jgi:TPR repeat protein
MYFVGTTLWRRTPLNVPEAEGKRIFACYTAAAALGHRESLRWLPTCYQRGIGTAIDLKKAAELRQKFEEGEPKVDLDDDQE